jgi:hypothetical protein
LVGSLPRSPKMLAGWARAVSVNIPFRIQSPGFPCRVKRSPIAQRCLQWLFEFGVAGAALRSAAFLVSSGSLSRQNDLQKARCWPRGLRRLLFTGTLSVG